MLEKHDFHQISIVCHSPDEAYQLLQELEGDGWEWPSGKPLSSCPYFYDDEDDPDFVMSYNLNDREDECYPKFRTVRYSHGAFHKIRFDFKDLVEKETIDSFGTVAELFG